MMEETEGPLARALEGPLPHKSLVSREVLHCARHNDEKSLVPVISPGTSDRNTAIRSGYRSETAVGN